jgi:hypothetical protein
VKITISVRRLHFSIYHAVALLLLFVVTPASADHPSAGIGSELAGPINTITPETLPHGKWSASFRTEYISFDEISDTKLSEYSAQGRSVHSTGSLVSQALSVAFGLTSDLTIAARLPYVERRNLREAAHGHEGEEDGEDHHAEAGGVEKLGNSSGFGDATLYGQYRYLNDSHSSTQGSMIFGIKMPTGDTDEKSREGERFETEHQPGSGSWDPMVGLALSTVLGNVTLGASVLYIHALEGSQHTDLGDGAFYSLALAHRLGASIKSSVNHHDHSTHSHGGWDVMLEINGEWRDKADIRGIEDGNTGGNQVFASPGVRYTSDAGWVMALSAGIPVVNGLNGTQSEPDWRVMGNVGFAF